MKNALCTEVVALGASMQVATQDSSPIVGKPEVIQVGPISNDKSACRKLSPRLAATLEGKGNLEITIVRDHREIQAESLAAA